MRWVNLIFAAGYLDICGEYEWHTVNYAGTSAGTILGPLLFVIYLHDCPKSIAPKFADDAGGIAVWETNENTNLNEKLQTIVDDMYKWSNEWGMQLNIKKTKVMCFGEQEKINVSIEGKLIELVLVMKYLGILLDSNLKFEQQTEFACTKAKSTLLKLGPLIKGRRGLSIPIGLQLYKSLIHPHLEYGIVVWSYIGDQLINDIEQPPSIALRQITGALKTFIS